MKNKISVFTICMTVLLAVVLYVSCAKTDVSSKEIARKTQNQPTIILGEFKNGEFVYRFDFDKISTQLQGVIFDELGEEVVIEDISILDSMPHNPKWRAEVKVAIFSITNEIGATAWYYIEKEAADDGGIIYFVDDKNPGGNQPNFICKQRNCKGVCVREATFDDNNNMTSAACICTKDPTSTLENPHFCEASSVNSSEGNVFERLWKMFTDIWK